MPRWGLASFVLIAGYTVLAVLQWPLSPKFIDIYYHLSVMKGFAGAGGWAAHAFWENAPAGRPHLYPPLFHWLLLALYKIGLGEITLARLVELALVPLTLTMFHQVVKNASGERAAFFAVLVLSSVYSLYLSTVTLAAFSVALLMALWAYELIRRESPVWAGLVGALVFYTHSGMALCLITAWAVYALLSKESRTVLVRAIPMALFASLPFTAFQAAHAAAFHPARTRELFRADIDLSVLAFALIAVVLLPKSRDKLHAPLSLLAGMLPLLAFSPYRYLSGHGLIGAVWLSAVALDAGWDELLKRGSRAAGRAVLLLGVTAYFQLFAPVLRVDIEKHAAWPAPFDRTFWHLFSPGRSTETRDNENTVYFPRYYGPLVEAVKNSSDDRDIVWSNWEYAGGLTALLAGRATSTSMLAEVRAGDGRDAMRDARIHVWFKDPQAAVEADIKKARGRYGLRLVFENEFAFVFENPSGYAKRR